MTTATFDPNEPLASVPQLDPDLAAHLYGGDGEPANDGEYCEDELDEDGEPVADDAADTEPPTSGEKTKETRAEREAREQAERAAATRRHAEQLVKHPKKKRAAVGVAAGWTDAETKRALLAASLLDDEAEAAAEAERAAAPPPPVDPGSIAFDDDGYPLDDDEPPQSESEADAVDEQPQEPAPAVPPPDTRLRVDDDKWREQLVTRFVGPKNDRREVVLAIPANLVTFFRFDPRWKDVLAYDEFAECVVTLRAAPWHAIDKPKAVITGALTDTDIARIGVWFSRVEGLHVTDRVVEQAVSIAADANRIHPVRFYLSALAWDGVPRLDEAAAKYFGAKSSEYSRLIVPRWFISTVARVMRPGCQADCVLILEGAQGWGKTSAFRALVPVDGWYADSGIVIGSKDSYQNLHGVWIYGFDELDSLSKSELTATKNFITATYDRYRPPYGRRPQNFTRQNTFVGSTNREDYLDDPTGNRRYWPLDVIRPLDVDAIRRDRDQLWAEAVHRYAAGERWYADTPELRKLCEKEQRDRVPVDAWAPIVADWLEHPTVPDRDRPGERRRLTDEDGVTTTEALLGALNMRSADIKPADAMRMGFVLRALGHTHIKRSSTGDRARRYREPSDHEARLDATGWTDASPREDTANPSPVQPAQHDQAGTQEGKRE